VYGYEITSRKVLGRLRILPANLRGGVSSFGVKLVSWILCVKNGVVSLSRAVRDFCRELREFSRREKEKFASLREIRGWFSHLLPMGRLPKMVFPLKTVVPQKKGSLGIAVILVHG
jgi:hypothetical protein